MMDDLENMALLAEHADQPADDLAITSPPARRVAVLVLGMHRSGSSAITRMLSLLGCTLPSTLMPAAPTNPAGHWESDAIAQFNDEILTLAGTHWHDWLPVNARLPETLIWPQLVARGRATLRGEFGDAPLFVLKDPRICKLAGLWLEVLSAENVDAAIVIPLRNPVEVARSLAKRDGIDEFQGLLIWLRHVLAAEAATRGRSRVFTDFAALLNNWEGLAVRLSDGLGLVWPRRSALSGSEISQFLTPDLRHHVSGTDDIDNNPSISPWVQKAYEVLLGWARHGEKPADYPALDQILREFDNAGTAFARPLLHAGLAAQRAAQADSERTALVEERDSVVRRLGEVEAGLAQTCVERDARATERDELAGERAALVEERDNLARRLEEVLAEFAQVSADRHTGMIERDELAHHRDALAAERDHLEHRLGELAGEFAQACSERDARATERDELAGERSALGEERDSLSRRLGELAAEFAAVCGERDARATERDELADQLAALAEDRNKVAWRLGEVEAEFRQVCAERDARAAERGELADQLAAVAEDRNKVAWRLGEVEAEVRWVCGERDALVAERGRLALERHDLAEACDKLAETGDKVAGRLGEIEAELAAEKAEIENARAVAAGLEEDLVAAHAGTDSLKHRLAVTESTLRQREEEISQLRNELLSQQNVSLERLGEVVKLSQLLRELEVAEQARDAQGNSEQFALQTEIVLARQALAHLEHRQQESSAELVKLTRELQSCEQMMVSEREHREWLRSGFLAMTRLPWWWHFLPPRMRRQRELERLRQRGLFDADEYLARYPDVGATGLDPLRHYVRHGIGEGRTR